MTTKTFENQDLAAATFHNVNLHRATFTDVNLGGATIRDANLKDMTIREANIDGLTIFDLRIDHLIEAELDRRDPERLRLRMVDVYNPDNVRQIMSRLDDLRATFYAQLRAIDHATLIKRPQEDEWSILEIVRHLLFVEDMYITWWTLQSETPLNDLGLRPTFLDNHPRFTNVGSQPSQDLETVLTAWTNIHQQTQTFLATITPNQLQRDTSDVDFGYGTVGNILQGLANHDLHHIREAERLIERLG